VITPAQFRDGIRAYLVANKAELGFSEVPADVMLAQSMHETDAWTSNMLLQTNNAWGMMRPKQRQTTAIGGYQTPEGEFAVYSDVYSSTLDYLIRQSQPRNHIPNTSDPLEYMQATVASGYATDPNYLKKWIARYKQLTGVDLAQEQSGASAGGGALLILLALWAISR
jgi:flagellum-specific peptidoglycan hydrolase FlgJ